MVVIAASSNLQHEKKLIPAGADDSVEALQTHLSSSWTTKTNIPSLICAFLASVTTGGTTYAFGMYSTTLKESFSLTQSELDTISSANFCAGLLSWIPGLLVDRFGSRLAMSGGGIVGALSLVLYWAVAKSLLPVSRDCIVPTLSVLGVFIFLSNSTVIGSVFKILVRRCTLADRGTAVGIAKGYVGLGAGAYATLFMQLRTVSESDLDFLLMAAFCNLAASTVPALLLLPSKQYFEDLHHLKAFMPDALTPFHFILLYASLIAMAVLIIARSLLTLYRDTESVQFAEGGDDRNYGMASLIVAVWFLPILCLMLVPQVVTSEQRTMPTISYDNNDEEINQATNLIRNEAREVQGDTQKRRSYGGLDTENYNECVRAQPLLLNNQDDEGDEKNLLQMLATIPAWLFLWTATILVGGGIVITNNMGQMVQALHFPDVVAPSALALFSVAQALTRVATGTWSDAAMNHATTPCCGIPIGVSLPRPAFLIIASFAGFISHLILAFSRRLIPFVVGVALSGAAFGMIWPLMVLIVGEVFGSSNVGANYMLFDGFSCAAGTIFLSKFVAQNVYESHIVKGGDDVTCYGMGCYQMSHFIVAGLSLTCVGTSVGVLLLTRNTYSKILGRPSIH